MNRLHFKLLPVCVLLIGGFFGCMHDKGVEVSGVTSEESVHHDDPYINKLAQLGLRNIVAFRGEYLAGDISFTKETIDAMTEKAEAVKISQGGALGKSSGTRMDFWTIGSPLFDVKGLLIVSGLKIWFDPSVPTDWKNAFYGGIAMWNDRSLSSPVRIIETSTQSEANILVTYEPRPVGIVATTSVTPDHLVVAMPIKINNYYAPDFFSYSEKVFTAAHEIGHVLNFGHTDEVDQYITDNSGIMVYGLNSHILGTTYGSGDPYSVMNSSVLPYISWFSPSDRLSINAMYPAEAAHTRQSNSQLRAVNGTINVNVKSFIYQAGEAEQPYLVWQKTDNTLWFKSLEEDSYSTQVWPGSGSSGTVQSFRYDRGFWAVKTTTGKIYTKASSSSWVYQGDLAVDFRLSGERLVVNFGNSLYSKYLSSNPGTWVYEGAGSLGSFAVRDYRLVAVFSNMLYEKVGPDWVQLYSSAQGQAKVAYLSENYVALLNRPVGASSDAIWTRPTDGTGDWTQKIANIVSANDIHLCGDRLAALQYGYYLHIFDLPGNVGYPHISSSSGPLYTRAVQLSGPNCDFVSRVDNSGILWGKYGIQTPNGGDATTTGYLQYHNGVIANYTAFSQR